MSVENFVPEIWSAALLQSLRDRLVYGQSGVINRNYEGEIAQAGDTVHITAFGDPEVREYEKNENISWDLLESTQQSLVVDQSDYFAFRVDDIDRRQALAGFVEESTTGASYNLASETDEYLAGLMSDAVPNRNDMSAGQSGDTVTIGGSSGDAYNLLVNLRTLLTRSNTPDDGRFVVVPPEMYGVLLKDDRFIRADASGTTSGLRNGVVGRAAGFDVIEGNRVPEDSDEGTYRVIAGHGIATTFAEQIASTEALRLENTFGDGLRGLHLYGARVIRPSNLAAADVSISDGDD